MRHHYLLTLFAVPALLLTCARPASADINNGSGAYGGGSTTSGGGQVVVAVPGSSSPGWPAHSYKSGGGSAAQVTCGYFTLTANARRGLAERRYPSNRHVVSASRHRPLGDLPGHHLG